jgi:hypothetical protein
MDTRFLYHQYKALLQSLPERKGGFSKCYFAVDAVLLFRRYLLFLHSLRQSPRTSSGSGKTCSVILLSHNRPYNLNFIVDTALRNQFVDRVVVSNSNRRVKIGEWVHIKDPKLVLIDETKDTGPGRRFALCCQSSCEYFLSVDDDIFLTPNQWKVLFEQLVLNDAVPHGIKGNQYEPKEQSSGFNVFNAFGLEQEVDVLVGAYAFTRQHLNCLLMLAEVLNIGQLSDLRNGEDILLSFSGTGKPRIHSIGRIMECASNSLRGVAISKTIDSFMEERARLFEKTGDARRKLTAVHHWA